MRRTQPSIRREARGRAAVAANGIRRRDAGQPTPRHPLERETRLELATLCLGSRCAAIAPLPHGRIVAAIPPSCQESPASPGHRQPQRPSGADPGELPRSPEVSDEPAAGTHAAGRVGRSPGPAQRTWNMPYLGAVAHAARSRPGQQAPNYTQQAARARRNTTVLAVPGGAILGTRTACVLRITVRQRTCLASSGTLHHDASRRAAGRSWIGRWRAAHAWAERLPTAHVTGCICGVPRRCRPHHDRPPVGSGDVPQ